MDTEQQIRELRDTVHRLDQLVRQQRADFDAECERGFGQLEELEAEFRARVASTEARAAAYRAAIDQLRAENAELRSALRCAGGALTVPRAEGGALILDEPIGAPLAPAPSPVAHGSVLARWRRFGARRVNMPVVAVVLALLGL